MTRMNLELSDERAEALMRLLREAIDGDHYPLSARIQTLRAVLGKLKPEPVREPPPSPKRYEPARATAARRHRSGR